MTKIGKIRGSAVAVSLVVVIWTATIPSLANEKALETAVKLFEESWEGDSSKIWPCIEAFEQLKLELPESAEVLAYMGTCYGFAARDAWNPMKKGEYGDKGLRYIDIAVDMEPSNQVIRVHSANYQLALPRFFYNRRDQAIEDIILLDKLFRESPSQEIAELILPLYEELVEEAPDRGDWSEGIAMAEKWSQK